MRALLAILVLGACGGGSHTTPPPQQPKTTGTPGTSAKPATVTASPDVGAVCARLAALSTAKCGEFVKFTMTTEQCVKELGPETGDPTFQAFSECLMNSSCEEVTNCMKAAEQASSADSDATDPPQNLRGCTDSAASGDAVGIPNAEWAKRNGAGLTKFSQATSSKVAPVEMCGIPAENRWLGTLTCDDGSKPIKNVGDAENVRGGNVGEGGRCKSIIDVYNVKCPEKIYPIYIDAYVCPVEN